MIDESQPSHFHPPLTDLNGPALVQIGGIPSVDLGVGVDHLSIMSGMGNPASPKGSGPSITNEMGETTSGSPSIPVHNTNAAM